jgi:hypothetical protein
MAGSRRRECVAMLPDSVNITELIVFSDDAFYGAKDARRDAVRPSLLGRAVSGAFSRTGLDRARRRRISLASTVTSLLLKSAYMAVPHSETQSYCISPGHVSGKNVSCFTRTEFSYFTLEGLPNQ